MNIHDHDKVAVASIHFEGKAMEWYYQISLEGRLITWEHFMELISNRFGDLKESRVFTEICKLKVKGSLEDYIDKFQELRSHLLMFQKGHYDDSFLIHCFVSGLSDKMRKCLEISAPQNLTQTIEVARMHEATIEAASERNRGPSRVLNYSPNTMKRGYSNFTPHAPEVAVHFTTY